MPKHDPHCDLSPAERREEIAEILAKGVMRWRRRANISGVGPAKENRFSRKKPLEVLGQTRLSVPDRTAS